MWYWSRGVPLEGGAGSGKFSDRVGSGIPSHALHVQVRQWHEDRLP